MGGRGRHPDKALTSVQVRALKLPGSCADGNGLYLVVEPSGSERWLLRIIVQGRRRDIGLGGAGLVTHSEAREKALAYRRLARDGGDPLLSDAKRVRPRRASPREPRGIVTVTCRESRLPRMIPLGGDGCSLPCEHRIGSEQPKRAAGDEVSLKVGSVVDRGMD